MYIFGSLLGVKKSLGHAQIGLLFNMRNPPPPPSGVDSDNSNPWYLEPRANWNQNRFPLDFLHIYCNFTLGNPNLR